MHLSTGLKAAFGNKGNERILEVAFLDFQYTTSWGAFQTINCLPPLVEFTTVDPKTKKKSVLRGYLIKRTDRASRKVTFCILRSPPVPYTGKKMKIQSYDLSESAAMTVQYHFENQVEAWGVQNDNGSESAKAAIQQLNYDPKRFHWVLQPGDVLKDPKTFFLSKQSTIDHKDWMLEVFAGNDPNRSFNKKESLKEATQALKAARRRREDARHRREDARHRRERQRERDAAWAAERRAQGLPDHQVG